jgi:hypothetical protein
MALTAPFAVGFPGHPFHEPFHAKGVLLPLWVKVSPIGAGPLQPWRRGSGLSISDPLGGLAEHRAGRGLAASGSSTAPKGDPYSR